MAKNSTPAIDAGAKAVVEQAAAEAPSQDAALLAAADAAKATEEQAAADAAKATEEQVAADAAKAEGKVLIVRAVSPTGRRRAGFGFHAEPTELLVADLTEEQLELILSDPQLSTTVQ